MTEYGRLNGIDGDKAQSPEVSQTDVTSERQNEKIILDELRSAMISPAAAAAAVARKSFTKGVIKGPM